MVRRIVDVVRYSDGAHYQLECGHQVRARDYEAPRTRQEPLMSSCKAVAFCSHCWVLNKEHPAARPA